jgi:hypothetical protein
MTTYNRNYTFKFEANPTIPGLTTKVTQILDLSKLDDRYIKRLTNALRRHGIVPRYGGQFQLVALLARELGLGMPIGFSMRSWDNSAVIAGWNYKQLDYPNTHFDELRRLSDVRYEMATAAGTLANKYGHASVGGEKSTLQGGWLRLLGWPRKDMATFRDVLRHRVLTHIPNYLDDMRKIADFIETRPKFVVGTSALRVVNQQKHQATLSTKKKAATP